MTGSQDTFDPQLTQRFPGLTRVGAQIERPMKGHRQRPRRGHYFFHPQDIDLAISIQHAGHQPGEAQIPHHANIVKHRGELFLGVAEIAAARANDRMHREGNRLAGRDQHPIRGG